jgi:N4-gp56 family major capsid protein
MAEVTLASSSARQTWITKVTREYIRASGFMPYMGTGPSNIFVVKNELQNEAGKVINIPLFQRLKGTGVTGSQILIGNEEDLANYNAQISIEWKRNGVRIPKSTSYLTDIDMFDVAKPALRDWLAEALRDDIIQALASIIVPGATGVQDTAVNYADSDATQRNAFAVANVDRLLFGKLKSNYSATFATALGNIDNTDDKLSTGIITLAKRMAKVADPHIRPFRTEDGREYFVLFAHPMAFRDLQADTAMLAANRDARARDVGSNPIFQDGDLIYNGVIIREIPELTNVEIASTITVAQNFLCGQGAVGIAYGQQPTPRQDLTYDYSFRPGVAIEELRGQRKLSWGGKQMGVFTVYTAGVADS